MSEEIDLRTFRIKTIRRGQLPLIKTRLILLNVTPGRASTYIVTAFPENAKEKGNELHGVVSTWPEVVIGIISESGRDGNVKLWDLRPTLRKGNGWRKKSIWSIGGRERAARFLLEWTADRNEYAIKRGWMR